MEKKIYVLISIVGVISFAYIAGWKAGLILLALAMISGFIIGFILSYYWR